MMRARASGRHRWLRVTVVLAALSVASAVDVVDSTAAPDRRAVAPDTRLVSIGMNGQPANGPADRPEISDDGRYVVFDSTASNLVPGVGFKERRVYRRDLQTGRTEMVSVSAGGRIAANWSSFGWPSADGNLVAFVSDDHSLVSPSTVSRSVFLRNMSAGATELISVSSGGVRANGPSTRPMLSPNGRFVAFNSRASNLGPLGGNSFEQLYLRDRLNGTTTLVSVDPAGGLGNANSYRGMVSNDGRFVAFSSMATDLVADGGPATEAVYLRDLQSGRTVRVSRRSNGAPVGGARPYLTPDGQQVVYNSYSPIAANDTTGFGDVYVYDRTTGASLRASVTEAGGSATGDSLRGFVTDDHRLATFNSFAGNLAAGDNKSVGDAFLHDMVSGKNIVLSVGYDGRPADAMSYRPVPDADGSVVVYQSAARNLVAGDRSVGEQVYVVTTATLSGGSSDTAAPTVAVSRPAALQVVTSPVTFTGSATDDRGVQAVDLRIRDNNTLLWLQPGGAWGATARRLPTTLTSPGATTSAWRATIALPDGAYGFDAQAFDAAGSASPRPWRIFSSS